MLKTEINHLKNDLEDFTRMQLTTLLSLAAYPVIAFRTVFLILATVAPTIKRLKLEHLSNMQYTFVKYT